MYLESFQQLQTNTKGHFTGTAAALGTTAYIDPAIAYTGVILFVSALTAETIAVTGTKDGTNFEAALKPIDTATGQPVATTALPVGIYILPVGYMKYKFTKSGAVNVGTVSYIASGVPQSGREY